MTGNSFTEKEVVAIIAEILSDEENAQEYLDSYISKKASRGSTVGFRSQITVDMKFPPETNRAARLQALREVRQLARDGVELDVAVLDHLVANAKGIVP